MATEAEGNTNLITRLFVIFVFTGIVWGGGRLLISTAAPAIQPTNTPVYISITNQGFVPGVVTATLGAEVVWTNNTVQTAEVVGGAVYYRIFDTRHKF